MNTLRRDWEHLTTESARLVHRNRPATLPAITAFNTLMIAVDFESGAPWILSVLAALLTVPLAAALLLHTLTCKPCPNGGPR